MWQGCHCSFASVLWALSARWACSDDSLGDSGLPDLVELAGKCVWRSTEAVHGIPIGAEVPHRRGERLEGTSIGARGIGVTSSGAFVNTELVANKGLEPFLGWHSILALKPGSPRGRNLCQDGRFLRNDPRVGLFHNQRISYETALTVAGALGRTLEKYCIYGRVM